MKVLEPTITIKLHRR